MAKKSKTKIPKTIAGIKVPKDLRKAGEALIEKANSPQGCQLIATGLSMAAAAAAAAADRRHAKAAPPEAPPAPEAPRSPETPHAPDAPTPPQGVKNPQAIGDAIGNAVEQAMRRAFGAK